MAENPQPDGHSEVQHYRGVRRLPMFIIRELMQGKTAWVIRIHTAACRELAARSKREDKRAYLDELTEHALSDPESCKPGAKPWF